ncbi:phosphate acyltransferase PlsX [Mycoplasma enhydrae]|uniref:phosphate acyltransferase PlsX n=1 Tax=Mycoplasma enhydrae TaxID=2499220 RepID=UPI00197B111D|nr:phosphate acyltransferase PlsX [Mycoplasma enhydrae]MBN4089724.1 phosphate acyltransferase PlsX [Mycoplasma enhydrae]MCV3753316.1 phosphate acyltransferase PlsX [Mycoplasma enhydrae]
MKKIVFDILNNDNGHYEATRAALKFKKNFPEFEIILVGDEKYIEETLKEETKLFTIINSCEIAHIKNSPRDILKNKSSMLDAFNYLVENDCDAILSSGDSGSLITLSSLKIKRLPNVSRPAFMPVVPTTTQKNILLLDAGANVETPADYLNNWALVATKYYQKMFENKNPIIGLLNIGTEDYKGNENVKLANSLLKANKAINYHGFIEPKDAVNGVVDIVIAEGQTGNIFLKTMEASFMGFGSLLKQSIMSNFISKIGGWLLKPKLKQIKNRFDYRNVGGAYIIGLEKIVIKAHGSSDELAFYNSLNQIKNLLDNQNFISEIKNNLEEIQNE